MKLLSTNGEELRKMPISKKTESLTKSSHGLHKEKLDLKHGQDATMQHLRTRLKMRIINKQKILRISLIKEVLISSLKLKRTFNAPVLVKSPSSTLPNPSPLVYQQPTASMPSSTSFNQPPSHQA
jgi:hypothetical protein